NANPSQRRVAALSENSANVLATARISTRATLLAFWRKIMRSGKEKVLFNLLLGTGIYLLDSMRNRMSGTVEDMKARAYDTFDTATDRVSRAADVIRGNDSSVASPIVAGLLGLGIGVGIGMLIAPASGDET